MTASISALPASPAAPASPGLFASSFADFSFHDLLSIVNPLQHLPIVSTLYRAVTGDTIKPLERIAGDALYGGLWGFVSSVANVAFQEVTGKDFGDTALALLEGGDSGKTAVASAAPSGTVAPAAAVTAPTAPTPAKIAAASVVPPAASVNLVPSTPKVAANAQLAPLQGQMPAPPQSSATDNAAAAALMTSMQNKGIDSELTRRAFDAYNKSLRVSPMGTVPTS